MPVGPDASRSVRIDVPHSMCTDRHGGPCRPVAVCQRLPPQACSGFRCPLQARPGYSPMAGERADRVGMRRPLRRLPAAVDLAGERRHRSADPQEAERGSIFVMPAPFLRFNAIHTELDDRFRGTVRARRRQSRVRGRGQVRPFSGRATSRVRCRGLPRAPERRRVSPSLCAGHLVGHRLRVIHHTVPSRQAACCRKRRLSDGCGPRLRSASAMAASLVRSAALGVHVNVGLLLTGFDRAADDVSMEVRGQRLDLLRELRVAPQLLFAG